MATKVLLSAVVLTFFFAIFGTHTAKADEPSNFPDPTSVHCSDTSAQACTSKGGEMTCTAFILPQDPEEREKFCHDVAQIAATIMCLNECKLCCLDPAYACEDKTEPRINCSSLTTENCQSTDPQEHDIVLNECPLTCGLCEEHSATTSTMKVTTTTAAMTTATTAPTTTTAAPTTTTIAPTTTTAAPTTTTAAPTTTTAAPTTTTAAPTTTTAAPTTTTTAPTTTTAAPTTTTIAPTTTTAAPTTTTAAPTTTTAAPTTTTAAPTTTTTPVGTTTTPMKITTAPTVKTTSPPEVCADIATNCDQLRVHCNDPLFYDLLNKSCKMTCRFCSVAGCVDASQTCAAWARNGFCENPTYTLEEKKYWCSKTCQLC